MDKTKSATIKYKLDLANISQSDIAKQLNVKPASVFKVIHGINKSTRISKAIAKAVGEPVEVLFPETFEKQAA